MCAKFVHANTDHFLLLPAAIFGDVTARDVSPPLTSYFADKSAATEQGSAMVQQGPKTIDFAEISSGGVN